MSLGLLAKQRKVEMCQRDGNREGEREGSGKKDDSQRASDSGTDCKSGGTKEHLNHLKKRTHTPFTSLHPEGELQVP